MITTTYRDIEISFDEKTEKWICELNNKGHWIHKLKDCKLAIDKYLAGEAKVKEKFQRLEVYKRGYADIFGKVVITSISDNGDVWITDGKNREKYSEYQAKNLALANDKNERIIASIHLKQQEIKQLDKDIQDLMDSMDTYKPIKIS